MKKRIIGLSFVCILFLALPFIMQAKECCKDNPDIKEAMEMSRNGRNEEAVTAINTIIQQDPGSIQAHISLGLVYYKMKQYDNSLDEFSKTIALRKESPMAYYFTGLIYEEMAMAVSGSEVKNLKRKALDSWQNYLEISERSGQEPSESHRHIGITKKESILSAKKHIKVLKEELENEKN